MLCSTKIEQFYRTVLVLQNSNDINDRYAQYAELAKVYPCTIVCNEKRITVSRELIKREGIVCGKAYTHLHNFIHGKQPAIEDLYNITEKWKHYSKSLPSSQLIKWVQSGDIGLDNLSQSSLFNQEYSNNNNSNNLNNDQSSNNNNSNNINIVRGDTNNSNNNNNNINNNNNNNNNSNNDFNNDIQSAKSRKRKINSFQEQSVNQLEEEQNDTQLEEEQNDTQSEKEEEQNGDQLEGEGQNDSANVGEIVERWEASFASDDDPLGYYHVLGLSKDATKKEIRKKYVLLMKLLHPDKLIGLEVQKEKVDNMYKKFSEAYEILYEEGKRDAYDNNYTYQANLTEEEKQQEKEKERAYRNFEKKTNSSSKRKKKNASSNKSNSSRNKKKRNPSKNKKKKSSNSSNSREQAQRNEQEQDDFIDDQQQQQQQQQQQYQYPYPFPSTPNFNYQQQFSSFPNFNTTQFPFYPFATYYYYNYGGG